MPPLLDFFRVKPVPVTEDGLREIDIDDCGQASSPGRDPRRWRPRAVAAGELTRRSAPRRAGQSFAGAAQRVNRACDRLLRDPAAQTVLVVSHISPIKILLCRSHGRPARHR